MRFVSVPWKPERFSSAAAAATSRSRVSTGVPRRRRGWANRRATGLERGCETEPMPGSSTVASAALMVIVLSLMERHLTMDGSRLVLDDDGAGAAIVCLHAIGHDATDFARLRARLRDRFRVIAVDWPGQGRSPRDAAPPMAGRYATLVGG